MILTSLLGAERVSTLVGRPQFDTLEALLDNELQNNAVIRKELSSKVTQALKQGVSAEGGGRQVVFRTTSVVESVPEKPSGKK